MKPSTNYIWLALFAAFLLAFSGCAAEKQKTSFKRDKWSETCPDGSYSVLDDDEGYVCAPLRTCIEDADCKYLELNKVPPRVGKCVERKCKAYCGSGTEWEC
jgi:hypothetical protein